MAKRVLPTIPQRSVPQFGHIQGGLLDGWSYGLADVEVHSRRVHLVLRATHPGWYFPTDVRMDPTSEFDQLRPGPGAVVHESKKLIQRAVDAQKHGWSE
jgi:hypothetical protein